MLTGLQACVMKISAESAGIINKNENFGKLQVKTWSFFLSYMCLVKMKKENVSAYNFSTVTHTNFANKIYGGMKWHRYLKKNLEQLMI